MRGSITSSIRRDRLGPKRGEWTISLSTSAITVAAYIRLAVSLRYSKRRVHMVKTISLRHDRLTGRSQDGPHLRIRTSTRFSRSARCSNPSSLRATNTVKVQIRVEVERFQASYRTRKIMYVAQKTRRTTLPKDVSPVTRFYRKIHFGARGWFQGNRWRVDQSGRRSSEQGPLGEDRIKGTEGTAE